MISSNLNAFGGVFTEFAATDPSPHFPLLTSLSLSGLSIAGLGNLLGVIASSMRGLQSLNIRGLNVATSSDTIPETIGKLYNLMSLSLSRHGLVGSVPQSLSQLKKLTALELELNSLSGAITDIHVSTSLKSLSLRNNFLSGTIPVSLSNLTYVSIVLWQLC